MVVWTILGLQVRGAARFCAYRVYGIMLKMLGQVLVGLGLMSRSKSFGKCIDSTSV